MLTVGFKKTFHSRTEIIEFCKNMIQKLSCTSIVRHLTKSKVENKRWNGKRKKIFPLMKINVKINLLLIINCVYLNKTRQKISKGLDFSPKVSNVCQQSIGKVEKLFSVYLINMHF